MALQTDMDDFTVFVGVIASGSLAINLYLIKSVANLCEKVGRLEGKLSRKWERPFKLRLDILD